MERGLRVATSSLQRLKVENPGLRMKKGERESDKTQRSGFLCQSGEKKKILIDCLDSYKCGQLWENTSFF